MKKKVTIDCFPESAHLYGRGHAIVAIDVIRASTSIVTALSSGRRCFPVPSIDTARLISARLANPLLAGEMSGQLPIGFEMNNSPSELASRWDTFRPLVLLSSSGTRLIHEAQHSDAVYIGCLRNVTSLTECLASRHPRVALIGAGSRGEFREEDQLACAWMAQKLVQLGYRPEGIRTEEIIEIWGPKKVTAIQYGRSAEYLRSTGQKRDLDFILNHIDDTQIVPIMQGTEAVAIPFLRPAFVPPISSSARLRTNHASYS